MQHFISKALGLFAFLYFAPNLHGEILRVDMQGGAPYTTIQSAVDAADNGDVIVVVRPQSPLARYGNFTIDGKALTIHGEHNTILHVGHATIRNLPFGEMVVLRGLDLARRMQNSESSWRVDWQWIPGAPSDAPGLTVIDCNGSVRVEDCWLEGSNSVRPWPAVLAFKSSDVSFDGCMIFGGVAPVGTPALQVLDSRVVVYRSRVQGGWGETTDGTALEVSENGGPGALLLGRSFLWLAGCDVRGGQGGSAVCSNYHSCTPVLGDGGAGVVVAPTSVCFRLESTIVGGLPGENFDLWGAVADEGPESVGSVQTVPGAQRWLDAPSVVSSGQFAALTLTGTVGEEIQIFTGQGADHRFFGPLFGAFLLRDIVQVTSTQWDVLNVSPVSVSHLQMPSVAPGSAKTFALQAIFRTPGNPWRFRVSNPRTVTVFGAALPPPVGPKR